MKPPERFAPDHPREWLNRARSSLALAMSRASEVYLEDLCFQAQQAAEKAIKAVLIDRRIEFPHVHDLSRLISILEFSGEAIPEEVRQAGDLTDYATTTRYPGVAEPVTEEEYATAVDTARSVVQWADERL